VIAPAPILDLTSPDLTYQKKKFLHSLGPYIQGSIMCDHFRFWQRFRSLENSRGSNAWVWLSQCMTTGPGDLRFALMQDVGPGFQIRVHSLFSLLTLSRVVHWNLPTLIRVVTLQSRLTNVELNFPPVPSLSVSSPHGGKCLCTRQPITRSTESVQASHTLSFKATDVRDRDSATMVDDDLECGPAEGSGVRQPAKKKAAPERKP